MALKPAATVLPPTHYTKNFKRSEMACRCGCGDDVMDEDFMQMLQTLRELCGFPLHITSAKRCVKHNKNEGGAKDSAHLTGKAADIAVAGTQAHTLLCLAAKLKFSGIGISQKGEVSKRFIHLDTVQPGTTRPALWSY